ncbi:MAG: LamG domain-containing protein, partial [Acidobacteria bacterium]|nr:LamG domain-containing protein [Acidobacteriota bacterium]
PAITLISPATAVAGTPGLALAVSGSNFVPGSVVRWNGQDRTTTPVDSAHLSAAITTADLAVAGTALVTVFNPAPGGGTTSPAPFTIGFLVACTPPPSGLVGWWPGDGNAWDLAAGNNGTPFNGADFAAGVVGQGFSLSGVSQYLDVGNPAALRVSAGDFTVDTWVKFNSLTHPPGSVTGPAGDMSIMDKMSATGINQDGWRLFKQDNNHFWFCLGGGGANGCGGGPSTLVQSATVATTGVWYHVTAVKTSSTISIYVNGVKETTTSLGPFTDTHAASLKIGASAAEGSYLNGLVDEAEVFNRALSDAEIATIYNASALGKCRAPMPAITSLLPSSATAGGAAFPLVVSGSNFQSNSVVRWNLSDRATTYGSATQLTAAIPATDIALAGTPKVTVFTPLGGESAPATFTITGLIACAAPPSGLVSWWTGEAGAQDITDGNSGTLLNGAATAPGEVGQALSFDGVDDRVLVPFNANLSPAGPFAVAVWFKPDPSQFSGDGLFMLVDKSHGFVDGTGWALQGVPAASSLSLGRNSVAGEMTFGFGLGGSSAEENYFAVGTGISVRDNVWHHVVGMFTGSEVQIYLDGILKESRPQATLPVNNSRDLYIGAAWGGGSPTRHFHGLIDEVQYFGRALSLAEIQKIVNAGGYGLCHQADLALTMTAPSSSTLGVNVNYTLTVTNNGPVAASGVVGILPLPVGASLVSSGASQGSCASSAVVTCALGNIGPGAAVTVNLLLHPTQSGTLTATASVSGNESDPMPSNNTAGASTSLSGWVYVVGDSAPGAGDGMGGFGDGMLDNLDLIGTLRAVTWVPGFRPPDCSDRFDAIDAYPTDTEVLRGGDGILDNLDLLASLRRVTNADPSRPTRTTLGCPTRAPGVVAMRRPALGPAGNLRLEFGEARADAGRGVVPIYLVGAARLELIGLSLALGLPGGGAPLAWLAGEAGAPTLTDNGLPGTLALSWLGGLRLQAGQRVLLGYAEITGASADAARLLRFFGAIANAADGRPLAVGLPSLAV